MFSVKWNGAVRTIAWFPVENSIEGAVHHTLDLFANSPLKICAQIQIPIEDNLLARTLRLMASRGSTQTLKCSGNAGAGSLHIFPMQS